MPGGSEKHRQCQRVLTEDEIRTFWEATDSMESPMRAFWRLRLITAQRAGEVKDMRWQDVSLEISTSVIGIPHPGLPYTAVETLGRRGGRGAMVWTIPAEVSKNGLSQRVPLSGLAIKILEEREFCWAERETDLYVLKGARSNNKRSAAAKLIGIEDFHGHDLRRTAASYMASAKIPRLHIAKVLNHAEHGVTAVYDRHSYDPEKRVALETWDRTLTAILQRDSSANVVPFVT